MPYAFSPTGARFLPMTRWPNVATRGPGWTPEVEYNCGVTWKIHQSGIAEWLSDFGEHTRFHGILSDPPYALISIQKRFGGTNAPAQMGSDGRYNRLSTGFMGQDWDGFESLEHYQDWVSEWAEGLIEKALYPGAICLFFGGTRTFHHLGVGLERGGFEIVDTLMWLHGQGFPKAHEVVPGYYTALKPAWEPIYLCRTPRGKDTYRQLMRMYGTGGLNIDGSRIIGDSYAVNTFDEGAKPFGDAVGEAYTSREETKGRWPANLILDEETGAMLDDQAGNKPGSHDQEPTHSRNAKFYGGGRNLGVGYKDAGGPSRFFYQAKASRKEKDKGLEDYYWMRTGHGDWIRVSEERWAELDKSIRARGCIHPTVKPLGLLRHLATLILPPIPETGKTTLAHPRRLLVPFSGSGSEMIAGLQAGWDIVEGVEMKDDYSMMATDRIKANLGML